MKVYILDVIEGRRSAPFFEKLLGGASELYRFAVFLRNFAYDRSWLKVEEVLLPVISVGNIAAGGTGKTPLIELLAKELQRHGSVAILSRGFRSQKEHAKEVAKVVPSGSAALYGDEPLLLARKLPQVAVWVGKNRMQSAKRALSENAEILLLDDGMQHRKLKRDLELVVLDGKDLWGYGSFLPRGLLRDSPKRLASADFVFISHCEGEEHLEQARKELTAYTQAPLIGVSFEKKDEQLLRNKRVGLFCGIGKKERFLQNVESQGATIVESLCVSDHASVPLAHLELFAEKCKKEGAEFLVCTEKDQVKLPENLHCALPIHALGGSLKVVAGHAVWQKLIDNIQRLL